jgi:uncharacterized protein YbcI
VHDQLGQGQLNAALANQIVKIVAETTGRGSRRSRAFVDGNVVVCVLEDSLTPAEQTLLEGGKADLVRDQRHALQDLMRARLEECVERITGRAVRTFISGDSRDGDASVEVFLLEPPE